MKLLTSLVLSCFFLLRVLAANNASDYNYLGSSPSERHVIDEIQAEAIINAAVAEASVIGDKIQIPLEHRRLLFNGAYTTADLYPLAQPGGPAYGIEETNGVLVVFGGGLPIFVDGYFIGSVGVSGGTSAQDVTVATAGVDAVVSTS
ncbi:MAG: hypothetical protein M1834_002609 [Cirrosporium novae-zelandiae]|nr:MAG: hypothetical protein M1834_002609 [Cirrosporium novae-zelandiae]